MLQYVQFKDYKRGKHLYRLWNSEYKRIYPISSKLFKERILDDINFDTYNSYVALYESLPIGFILVKKWQAEALFYKNIDTATISLFYVQKEARSMGVGTELLNLAMKGLVANESITKIQLGNDLLNIFPGLPSELTQTTSFLFNKGFRHKDGCVDMLQIVKKQDEQIEYNTEKPLSIRIATEEDKDAVLKLCLENNLLRELYLLKKYFENGGTGRRIVLGFVENKMIGFVRIYDKKINSAKVNFFLDSSVGSLGLFGIDKNYQEGNYAEKLVQEAIHYVVMRKCKKIMVEQTTNTEFYKKFGFRAFKYYMHFVKDIKRENNDEISSDSTSSR